MKTLVLCNQKGGVGKSAVATLLTHHLAQRGQRVLAIDLDHQGNFSKPLRLSGRAAELARTSDTLLTGPPPAVPAVPLVLVPSLTVLTKSRHYPLFFKQEVSLDEGTARV
jgi:chromosome partitioning protein